MLRKLEHPVLWVIVCCCFFAGFGFAVGEVVQRVHDACTVDAVCLPKNILELAGEYSDPRVKLFTAVFVIVALVEAGFFLCQLRLKRQVMRAAEKAAFADREAANEKRVLLFSLKEHNLVSELLRSMINVSNEG
jgi:hypothetical protein